MKRREISNIRAWRASSPGVFVLLLTAFVLSPASVLGSPCVTRIDLPYIAQLGPTCAAAASVMATRAFGAETEPIDYVDFARHIRVWKDGVSFFDIAEQLDLRGFDSLAIQGDATLAARLLALGVPVIAAVSLHGGKHAVTLVGFAAPDYQGRCGTPSHFRALDPASPTPLLLETHKLSAMQWAQQLFVTFPRGSTYRHRIRAAGLDLADLERQDRRFRAHELLLRAREHKTPNPDKLALLERAVAIDPTHRDAAALRDDVARALRPR